MAAYPLGDILPSDPLRGDVRSARELGVVAGDAWPLAGPADDAGRAEGYDFGLTSRSRAAAGSGAAAEGATAVDMMIREASVGRSGAMMGPMMGP